MINNALPTLENAVMDNFEKIALSDRSTGQLKESFGKVEAKQQSNGSYSGEVGFYGKDDKGVRNGLKAGVLEYGKQGQIARPFVRPAIKTAEPECMAVMAQTFHEEVNKIMN